MTLDEIADIENIVRRAKVIREIASTRYDGELTDNAEQLLAYAQGLLPEGNRFRRG